MPRSTRSLYKVLDFTLLLYKRKTRTIAITLLPWIYEEILIIQLREKRSSPIAAIIVQMKLHSEMAPVFSYRFQRQFCIIISRTLFQLINSVAN